MSKRKISKEKIREAISTVLSKITESSDEEKSDDDFLSRPSKVPKTAKR